MSSPDAYSPIPELNLLKALGARLKGDYYARGFELFVDYGNTRSLEHGLSTDPEFLGRLVPFAYANGSGSVYALWRLDERTDLATLPVVVFGDEGGLHVVARDLREFFQLLGYDCEISVHWDDAYYYRDDEECEPSVGHDEYVAWLDQHFALRPTTDPDVIVAAAREELGPRFATWVSPFLR